MAELPNEQSSAAGRSATRLLRYPLRSASKQNEEKPLVTDLASAPRRGRSASNVSKSVSVLDLSVKERSAKPPGRLSNPSKTAAGPASRPSGSITPISETRSKGSSGVRGKIDTPLSDVSKSSSKKKFNVLCSSSYWLNQIKLSEAAAKHSLSLGFFKLALEAGCEPLQRIRDELKSYARKHNLTEFGDSAKELFENYNITENFEQLQISQTCSHLPEEGTRSSDDDVHSTSSVGNMGQVKRNLLAGDAAKTMQVNQPKKEKIEKDGSVSKLRKSITNKNLSSLKSPADTQGRNSQKRPQKTKQELSDDKVKKSAKKPAHEDSIDPLVAGKTLEENKENLDTPNVDEIETSEV
ncbi:hypothetical protein LIER_10039 [Lithospermum erythrorhizon]|uniref:Uncharacterized protein n=1 Tax=Lithospermum erythrorhizon TaxID=34254 RepID=A0AAV3PK70_LITER